MAALSITLEFHFFLTNSYAERESHRPEKPGWNWQMRGFTQNNVSAKNAPAFPVG